MAVYVDGKCITGEAAAPSTTPGRGGRIAAAPRRPRETDEMTLVQSFKAQWDAVSGCAGARRRSPQIETTGENGAQSQQLSPLRRLQMLNLCRDAVRNFSTAKTIIRQISINVAGESFKLRFRAKGEEYRAAEKWFNKTFAKACDFRSDRHLSDFNTLLLSSVVRDGDCGLAFDGAEHLATGKLIAYESDQICDADTIPRGFASMVDGVLFDRYGREAGYLTNTRHGRTVIPLKNCTIWKRDPDDPGAASFTLLRMPWRFGQVRGTGELYSCIADILDVYEMRSKELQTAKVASTLAAKVTRQTAPVPVGLEAALDPTVPEDELEAMEDETSGGEGETLTNYVNLEALTGGNTVYGQEGDNIEFLDPHNRPNLNTEEFAKRVIKSAAAGCGLGGCYATLEPETSYTAFRGSLILTWMQVRVWQKWYERHIQDWEAVRAIRFAMDLGTIPQLPEGWDEVMAWEHPSMPQVDPQKDQAAFLAAMKNGAQSLQSELGMEYKDRLEEIADEIADFQRLGIPHPLFQTAAGAVIPTEDTNGGDAGKEITE